MSFYFFFFSFIDYFKAAVIVMALRSLFNYLIITLQNIQITQ